VILSLVVFFAGASTPWPAAGGLPETQEAVIFYSPG
jgi:hypothetical protein